MSAPLVRTSTTAGITTVVLDSPTNRNALSVALRAQLRVALDHALADPAVRVIVLAHTGPVFCSGMDLSEAPGDGVAEFADILDLIWSAPKPVIAALAGSARAGGIGLVAACDLAVSVDTADFSFSEVRLGVVPSVIAVPVLRRLPSRAAAALMLTGEVFDAAHAAAIGLITAAVTAENLDATASGWAVSLTRGGPTAIALTKARLNSPITAELQAAQELSAAVFDSEEGQEGMAAFRARRPPSWVTPG